jgi:hypothetical protein
MIPIMSDYRSAKRIAGRLLCVDPSNRLIRIWDGCADCEVQVPPGCEVRLNNEPIRLRLLETGDPVEVDAVGCGADWLAVMIRSGRV